MERQFYILINDYFLKKAIGLIAFLFFVSIGLGQQTFTLSATSSGSYQITIPCDVTSITVECWGAGGGGGGASANPSGGGGGAGGAYSREILTVVPGSTILMYVGAGGIGGVANAGNGAKGEDTYFNTPSIVKAVGGEGGKGNSTANSSAIGGIAATSGNVGNSIFYGGNGGTGINGTSAGGGGGSAGSSNPGGNGGVTTAGIGGLIGGGAGGAGGLSTGTGGAGNPPPVNTNGGGGGGGRKGNTTNRKGGSGADGKIVITFSSNLFYCTPDFPSAIEPITNVTFAGINRTTPNTSTLALEVFCDEATVAAGTSYPISVKGNTDGAFTNKIVVYIDWNRNQLIDANELTNLSDIYNSTGNDAIVSTGNITVPPGTTPGKTFMRVLKKYSTAATVCNTSGFGQAEDYVVNVIIPTPCSGTPLAGTAFSNPTSGSPSSTFTLSSTGSTNNLGITYQWQTSPNGSTGWTNIIGATTLNYNATAVASNTTTYYRLIVTCSNSGISATSNVITFITQCNAIANFPSGRYIKRIDFIGTLNDVSNTSTYSATGYQDFTTLPNKAIQAQNEGVNVYVESNLRTMIKAWVDWNKNGTFETSELVYNLTDYFTTTTTFGFVVPLATVPGNYKMRVRTYSPEIDFSSDPQDENYQPCGTFDNGETEDYLFTVTAQCPTRITGGADVESCGSGSVNLVVTGSAGTTLYKFYTVSAGGSPVGTTTSGTWATPDISSSTLYYVTASNGTCESNYRTPIRVTVKDIPVLSFSPVNPVVCGEGAVLQLDATGTTETGVLIDEKFESGLGSFYANMLGGNYPGAQWTTAQSPYVPTSTPVWRPAISSGFSGNYFAFITSDVDYSDINNALQLTNSVSTVGYTTLFLDADMFFDHYLADGDNTIVDRFFVEISTNGGSSWTTIENNNADIGIGTRFVHKSYNLTVPAYLNITTLKIRFRYLAEWTNGIAIDNVKLYGSKPLAPSFSWSPTSGGNLFTDVAGATPYTGGSVSNVYVKPTPAQLLAGTDLNFTATASLSNGCSASAPVTVKIGPSTWTGTVSNQWHNVNNWCSKTIPSASTIVEIPNGVSNFPVITTNAVAKNVIIKPGASLSIDAVGSLSVNSLFDNAGTLTNNGKIILNGTSPQSFPGTGVVNAMSELEISNSSGVTLNKSLSIISQLIPTSGNLDLGNFDITLLSGALKTASVSSMGINANFIYGTGRFVVQRYIATGSHGKGWQLLSSPLKEGQTIFNSWQNGGVATVGKGTLIHHNLYNGINGFDVGVAISPSIKSYNYLNNDWTIFPNNTSSSYLDNPHGYLLFVRGDRTVVFPANPTGPTVLSNRGKIYTGTAGFTPPSVGVNADKYESVGNPYPSSVDFTKLTRTGGVDNKFYVWDPLLFGAYQLGGYQVISAATGWKPVPGSSYYPSSIAKKTIESGQAFLVYATGTGGSVSFSESSKVAGSNLVNRPEDGMPIRILRANLITNNVIADGNAVVFDQDYSNEIDANDAFKILNSGENFGITRGNNVLSVEARANVVTADTIFYSIKKPLLNNNYNLVFEPENMDPMLHGFLIDNYLGTRSEISLSSITTININFNNDPNSYKEGRFMLIFQRQIEGPLPVTFVSVSAIKNNKDVDVKWRVENQINLENYIVERSTDGRSFIEIGSVLPEVFSNYSFTDRYPFSNDNFYRIKALSIGGMVQYSSIVKITADETDPSISVYPNPLVNNSVNIRFLNQASGKYSFKIINNIGQLIFSGVADVSGENFIKNIEVPKFKASGVYKLILYKPNGERKIIQLVSAY